MVSFTPMTREVAADAVVVLTRLESALSDVLRVVASIAVWGEPLEVVSAWGGLLAAESPAFGSRLDRP